jgi:hypothetical protein
MFNYAEKTGKYKHVLFLILCPISCLGDSQSRGKVSRIPLKNLSSVAEKNIKLNRGFVFSYQEMVLIYSHIWKTTSTRNLPTKWLISLFLFRWSQSSPGNLPVYPYRTEDSTVLKNGFIPILHNSVPGCHTDQNFISSTSMYFCNAYIDLYIYIYIYI